MCVAFVLVSCFVVLGPSRVSSLALILLRKEELVASLVLCCGSLIPESPAQFEKRIKPRVYVRRITHSTMYEKAPFC